jgi:large subunit ribosomal protein L23
MIDLVKRLVLTDKSVVLIEENDQYTFDVDVNLSKTHIKQFIENYYNVKVIRVNTHRPPRKKTRMGQGSRSQYKRVILTLRSGDTIPLFDQK